MDQTQSWARDLSLIKGKSALTHGRHWVATHCRAMITELPCTCPQLEICSCTSAFSVRWICKRGAILLIFGSYTLGSRTKVIVKAFLKCLGRTVNTTSCLLSARCRAFLNAVATPLTDTRQNMGKDAGSPRGLHRGVDGGCGWRG